MTHKVYNEAGDVVLELAEGPEEIPWFQRVVDEARGHLERLYAFDRELAPAWYRKLREGR